MKLSEMKQVLDAEGIRLTRSLGQNFLHDANQLHRILDAAELKQGDRVLEIGPGLGPLTALLLDNVNQVLAIEKDERLVQILKKRFASEPALESRGERLKLLHDDALEFLRREPRDWSSWKLVSNLPYSVASPILVELAMHGNGPERIVATLQIEVAQRLMAKASAADYGVLTLLVQLDYEPLGWFKIPASCFFPEPDVDSACISLKRRATPLLAPGERSIFLAVVKRSFSQRRKMMLKLLRDDWPGMVLEQTFAQLQLSPQTRAETVSLEQFVRLTRALASNSAAK
jgi:16S rRNA (adenine1518-N6/adenine1519-N6)-dimethyltransferase